LAVFLPRSALSLQAARHTARIKELVNRENVEEMEEGKPLEGMEFVERNDLLGKP
jgi:hypothetical protein